MCRVGCKQRNRNRVEGGSETERNRSKKQYGDDTVG